ncbi:MAG: ABC transporter ATP-binding protein [Flavobacterium sp.]|uniref:ABC transporter ATP-binding protein n=1 Tax=Flavobacterium sp. TaxID=239 RepID=UPI0012147291|nr:ABC transporter ATP-binding protein [Flavobacterium sp.]RZJ66936.1 MAG: ABC transporter ATP-binding protein [Flavobacterium sp.]
MHCLETRNLSHRFSSSEVILDDINLKVPSGSIYGFLGPNGAGKTTTLKLILGLLQKQQGEILIFGKTLEKNRFDILGNIGSLIENPSIYGHLTAIENLELLQKIYRCPKSRIAEVLELVGLSKTGNKKAGRFSLGMKQRLSIAISLLHDPSLLVLDEPTNGLDPNGILEIRELLKKLNSEMGITVIISSHLLPEIEKLVSHVGIIHKGKMMFQGTLDELKLQQAQTVKTTIDTGDNFGSVRILDDLGIPSEIADGKITLPNLDKETIAKITAELVRRNIPVYEISLTKNDLEMIFMDLIQS